MKLSQVIYLIAVQQNNTALISLLSRKREKELEELAEQLEIELDSRMLSKSTLAGLKRLCPRVGSSPKLSKVLIGLGLPEKAVSLALAAPNAAALPRVSEEMQDLLEQGDSIHYDSCQRTGGNLNEVQGEVRFLATSLWLYVIGERKSLRGEGFTARSKIRLLTKDQAGLIPAGFYIERPYGQFSALLSHLEVLREWADRWCSEKGVEPLPIFMPAVWNRDNGGGRDFQSAYGGTYHTPLFCPSAAGGYQDTMTRGVGPYDFFEEVGVKQKSLLRKAYEERPIAAGAYTCSLKEHIWNPQKWCFQHPPLAKEWRGLVDPLHRLQLDTIIGYLGYPKTKVLFEDNTAYYRESQDSPWVYANGNSLYAEVGNEWRLVIDTPGGNVWVFEDLPSMGFHRALENDDEFDLPRVRLYLKSLEAVGLEPVLWSSDDNFRSGSYHFKYCGEDQRVKVYQEGRRRSPILVVEEKFLEVRRDLPELGFWEAVEIPDPDERFVDVEDDD